jgi:hypothetical protein
VTRHALLVLLLTGTCLCASCSEMSPTASVPTSGVEAGQSGGSPLAFVKVPLEVMPKGARDMAAGHSADRVILVRIRYANGDPVWAATVSCSGTMLTAMTNERGVACLRGMAEDSLTFRVMAVGSHAFRISTSIKLGEVAAYDVRLAPVVPLRGEW